MTSKLYPCCLLGLALQLTAGCCCVVVMSCAAVVVIVVVLLLLFLLLGVVCVELCCTV